MFNFSANHLLLLSRMEYRTCVVFLRTNSTWLSSRSGGTPNTARIRSYASSGRRGRSAHELEIVGGKQTRNRDCFFLTAVDAFVCPAIAQPPSWLIQNRPDWLPFKSALTLADFELDECTLKSVSRAFWLGITLQVVGNKAKKIWRRERDSNRA